MFVISLVTIVNLLLVLLLIGIVDVIDKIIKHTHTQLDMKLCHVCQSASVQIPLDADSFSSNFNTNRLEIPIRNR